MNRIGDPEPQYIVEGGFFVEISTLSIIIGVLLAISEALSMIPAVKSNGIFQMFWNVLKIMAGQKIPDEQ